MLEIDSRRPHSKLKRSRACSSPDRAFGSGPKGSRFDSCQAHQRIESKPHIDLVGLDAVINPDDHGNGHKLSPAPQDNLVSRRPPGKAFCSPPSGSNVSGRKAGAQGTVSNRPAPALPKGAYLMS